MLKSTAIVVRENSNVGILEYWGTKRFYGERGKKVVIARSEATWQSREIASLRSQ